MKQTKHRSRESLIQIGKKYPGIWSSSDDLRKAKDELGWPDWCYLPMGGWHVIASNVSSSPLETASLTSKFAALGTWRVTQGIYRFDPALYPVLLDTPISSDIPIDVLYQLPEWCIYVETPDMRLAEAVAYGFWCHLEWDSNTRRHELRLYVDTDTGGIPVVLHLTHANLSDAITAALDESNKQSNIFGLGGVPDVKLVTNSMAEYLAPVLSLILYICSQSDFTKKGLAGSPANPAPKKTKKGLRIFPSSEPIKWDVGVRIGAALRQAYHAEETGGEPTGRQVRPHVRRAHWHTFVSGARKGSDGENIPASDRKRNLKWVPPIGVNVSAADELPATIKKVKK